MFYRHQFVFIPSLFLSASLSYAGAMGPVASSKEHWSAGVNFQVVQPFFQNNPEFYFLEATRFSYTDAYFSVEDTQHQRDVPHKMDLAPEFFLGYVGDNGMGARTRYWYYDENTRGFTVTPPTSVTDLTYSFPVSSAAPIGLDIDTRDNNLSNTMTVKTKLRTEIWDGILTKNYDAGDSTLVVGIGARYAYMQQLYNAVEDQQPGNTLDIRFDPPVPQFITAHEKKLRSGHDFRGWGPVILAEDKVPLWQTGFAIIGTGRAAAVFGPSEQTATKTLLVRGTQNGSDTLSETAVVRRTNHHQTVLGIIEAEAGIEYSYSLSMGRLAGQLSVVAQEWLGGGSASRSATTGTGFGLPGSGMTGASQVAAATSESNFGFLGAAFKLSYFY